jgi:cytochrome c peroxidase
MRSLKNISAFVGTLAAALLLQGCGGSAGDGTDTGLNSKEKLGEALFFDTNLSLHKTMACATCHDPDHGFVDARFVNEGDANPVHGALSVGDDGLTLGGRNAPTAAYALLSPTFHFDDASGEYVGGQFHDGRARDLKAQAKGPFLNPEEMMMPDAASVIDRIKENPDYVEAFKALYGEAIFDDVNKSYDAVGESIARFEKTDLFAPFDSKYDRYLDCKAGGKRTQVCLDEGGWSLQEQLGMDLFFSEANTNCHLCHQLNSFSETEREPFTSFGYDNIGTPKNLEALDAKGLDSSHVDHGLAGRDDINETRFDGMVKIPTLRNVAVTGPYMHNGAFRELRTVIEFYDHMGSGDRPNNPETLEPWGEPDVNATINRADLAMPAMDDAKIDALVAFLKTLTDRRYAHLVE